MIVKISLKGGYKKNKIKEKLDFKTFGTTARTRRIFEKKYET